VAESEATGGQASYRVLARKYRPQDFSTLIGQEPMVRTLTNAFGSNRIAQAWMLTGVRGVGKTTTARILARALNYQTKTVDHPSIELTPMGEHCQAIMEGRHVDVVEMDGASHTGIDDIRDLIEQSHYRPLTARYKVYIIDEVHMLSTQAFNGLLKTLEEPPAHVKFIFATTEIRKVPVTVLSRCQRFDLRRVEGAILRDHLADIAHLERIEAQTEALGMIARAAQGSVRDALSMLDQAIAHGNGRVEIMPVRTMLGLADRGQIIDLFEAIMGGQAAPALQLFKDLYDEGADPHVIVSELAEFNHLVTRLRISDGLNEKGTYTQEELGRGRECARNLGLRTLSQNWQMLLKGLGEIDEAPHPYQAAEMLLIRLSAAANLPPLDDVVKMVLAMRDGVPPNIGATATSAPLESPRQAPKDQEIEEEKKKPTSDFQPAIDEHSKADIAEKSGKIQLNDFAAILAHADKVNDLKFKTHLKEYVRPIDIAHGRFIFSAPEEAPRLLPNLIATTLKEWTGEHWTVTLQDDKGGRTFNEQAQAQREALLLDASQDEDVNAILVEFPGAQIVDVRLNRVDELQDELPEIELDERQEE